MEKSKRFEYRDDYVQSANTLFHFMKQREYLISALEKKALVPRYCVEDVDYMSLENAAGNPIGEIAVLQKCFCDIPFHKMKEKFEISVAKGGKITPEEKRSIEENDYNTHTGCYGEYAIAFSKAWSVRKGLQPVMYVNKESEYLREFTLLFSHVMKSDSVEDIYVDDLLGRIAYLKPLQGTMDRQINGKTLKLEKNFHDEKEWRYIPDDMSLRGMKLEKVIAKRMIRDSLNAINKNIELSSYEPIWLKFSYEDIKYIIVPNQLERLELIKYITGMTKEKTSDEVQKGVLISKIQVLEDIRRDW